MTAKEILLQWLKTALRLNPEGFVFKSTDIQMKAQSFGRNTYDKTYAPNNYMRRFREIREDKDYRTVGIANIEKISHPDYRQALWRAVPMEKRSTTNSRVGSATRV